MVLDTKTHPEQLKDEVCSPGGTSIHALHQLERAGYRGALMKAVEAGTRRSMEIGHDFNKKVLAQKAGIAEEDAKSESSGVL